MKAERHFLQLYDDVYEVIIRDPYLLQLYLLLKKNSAYKNTPVSTRYGVVTLKKGQLITSEAIIAMMIGVRSRDTASKRLDALYQLGVIDLKQDKRGTIVTVLDNIVGKSLGNKVGNSLGNIVGTNIDKEIIDKKNIDSADDDQCGDGYEWQG